MSIINKYNKYNLLCPHGAIQMPPPRRARAMALHLHPRLPPAACDCDGA
jgi:hypothetical protein